MGRRRQVRPLVGAHQTAGPCGGDVAKDGLRSRRSGAPGSSSSPSAPTNPVPWSPLSHQRWPAPRDETIRWWARWCGCAGPRGARAVERWPCGRDGEHVKRAARLRSSRRAAGRWCSWPLARRLGRERGHVGSRSRRRRRRRGVSGCGGHCASCCGSD